MGHPAEKRDSRRDWLQPKRKRFLKSNLQKLQKNAPRPRANPNATVSLMPDGSGRTLCLRLAEKPDLQVAIDP